MNTVIVIIGTLAMVVTGLWLPQRGKRRNEQSKGIHVQWEAPQTPAFVKVGDRAATVIVSFSLAVFVILLGPFWTGQYDSSEAVYASYAPVFVLVAAVLWRQRQLTLKNWVMDAVTLALIKFMASALLLVLIWAIWGPGAIPRPVEQPHAAIAQPTAEAAKRGIKPIDIKATSQITGAVVGADGRPIADAIVWISDGLQPWQFHPPRAPVEITHRDGGLQPKLIVVQLGQPLRLVSSDGRLHTIEARQDSKVWFTFPMLPRHKQPSPHGFTQVGLASLRCSAHPHEHKAMLLSLHHPYWVRTARDGRFVVNHVPAGQLTVSAVVTGREVVTTRVSAKSGDKLNLKLQL